VALEELALVEERLRQGPQPGQALGPLARQQRAVRLLHLTYVTLSHTIGRWSSVLASKEEGRQ